MGFKTVIVLVACLVNGWLFKSFRGGVDLAWSTVAFHNSEGKTGSAYFVRPKSTERSVPCVIYMHGAKGEAIRDGRILRQFAELGIAAISFDFRADSYKDFTCSFDGLRAFIGKQSFIRTNEVVWVGSSLGAQYLLNYVRQNGSLEAKGMVFISTPTRKAKVLESGVLQFGDTSRAYFKVDQAIDKPILFIHGALDTLCPIEEAISLARRLGRDEQQVKFCTLPNYPHFDAQEQLQIFRAVAGYCHRLLCLPIPRAKLGSASGSVARRYAVLVNLALVASLLWQCSSKQKSRAFGQGSLCIHRVGCCFLCLAAAILISKETFLQLPPTPSRLAFLLRTSSVYVPPEDYVFMAKAIPADQMPTGVLLDNLTLSNFRRGFMYSRLPEEIFQKCVLSPVIEPVTREGGGLRRVLWTYLYPRVRKETSPLVAASIIARSLREQLVISNQSPMPNLTLAWEQHVVDRITFEYLYVEGLRAVGVASRLSGKGHAEIWDGDFWLPAPRPLAESISIN